MPTRGTGWARPYLAAILALFLAGIVVRVLLWPARGLVGDLDQFVLWVHGIAVNGWDRAYDQNLSFPAVMAWVWGALAAVEPAFRTVTDSTDIWIRSLMKVPASIADLGIAAAVAWWFRDRPRTALAVTAAILLWPATWYVSAWWGQYEPIYVLPAVLALLAVRARRPGLAAALIALSLMTKPQALPFAVPFAAWFLATQGWRGTARAALIGSGVIVVAWLPFIAAGGPLKYLDNLGAYQNDVFSVLSLRAWNPWWVIQELAAGGDFVADGTAILGPLTFRTLGFVIAGLLSIVVFAGVYRRPTTEQLALGLAAVTLVAFVSLTTMHERYAYPALVFLLVAAAGNRGSPALPILWLVFAAIFALNLVIAVPPGPDLVDGVPLVDALTVAGSAVMTVIAGLLVLLVVRQSDGPSTNPRPVSSADG